MKIIDPVIRRFPRSGCQKLLFGLLFVCTAGVHATDGYYDSTFFYQGIDYFDFGPPAVMDYAVDDVASSVALMTDGRLVLAGGRTDNSFGDGAKKYAIVRLLRDGGTDATFALPDGSKVVGSCYMSSISSPLDPESHALGVAVQSDGGVVIGGYCRDRGNVVQGKRRAFIARHTTDGSPDFSPISNSHWSTLATFSGPYAGQSSTGRAVALQPDGKIVLVGDVIDSTTGLSHWFAARFNTDLTSDGTAQTFDIFYKDTFGFGADAGDYAYAVAVQADGKILVAGTATAQTITGTIRQIAVLRLTTALALDPAFNYSTFTYTGTPGFYVVNGTQANDGGTSVAINRRDGSLAVGGYCAGTPPNFSYCFSKLDADGHDYYGTYYFDFNRTGQHFAHGIAFQSDGKVVLSGGVDLGGGTYVIGTVRCCDADGYSPDPTFGAGGYSLAGYTDDQRAVVTFGYGMVLQNNHPVVVGSTDYYSPYYDEGTDFVVTRLNNEQVYASSFEAF